jgi:integrase
MRGLPKGVNVVRKRLADGTWVTYYYAWKGGPRLKGEPGTAEFQASYDAAINAKHRPPKGNLRSILDQYQESAAFMKLADRTKKDYRYRIKRIDRDFGDLPIAALGDRRIRGEFMRWRDAIGLTSPCSADKVFAVLARAISWAFDWGLVPDNPCKRPGLLYKGNRADKVWTPEQEAAFYEKAPQHLHLALTLGLWTGQRQGDLLRLAWSAFDGEHIRLKQRKTKVPVLVPVGGPLLTALKAARAKLSEADEKRLDSVPILANTRGEPWTSYGFSCSWRKACKKAGVEGVTFHDLRGTAVTRFALAECTVAEICAITGHSLKDASTILDRHYLKRDPELARSAIRKLEKSTRFPTSRPTKSQPPSKRQPPRPKNR